MPLLSVVVAVAKGGAALQPDGYQTDRFEDGRTKPPPEPTYSREGVKCCD